MAGRVHPLGWVFKDRHVKNKIRITSLNRVRICPLSVKIHPKLLDTVTVDRVMCCHFIL